MVDLGRFERLAIPLDSLIDALVKPGIVEQHLGLDLRHIGVRRDPPVIGDTRSEIRRIDGELVDEAAAPAEANRTDLAVRG
jgi:hypothetical protein